jgi:hypothetical protein
MKLMEFFSESGELSQMRLITFMVVGVVLFNWVFLTVTSYKLVPLDMNSVLFLLIAMGAKTIQKGIEVKNNKVTKSPE